MTATVEPSPPAVDPHVTGSVHPLRQAVWLSIRASKGTLRQPEVWLPSLLFPMFFATLNTASLGKTTALFDSVGLHVDSFLDFMLPATLCQGIMFGAIGSGTDLATDVQTGFFERLLATPVSRLSVLVGRLAGGMVLAAVQAVLFMSVFMVFGARIKSGPVGALVLVGTALLIALAIGGYGAALGLRTGNPEAVQGSFPLVFVALFASSAFFPTQLMNGWFEEMAVRNPVTWMIDGARSLVIGDLTARGVAKALGVPAGLAALTITWSLFALRGRLRAT